MCLSSIIWDVNFVISDMHHHHLSHGLFLSRLMQNFDFDDDEDDLNIEEDEDGMLFSYRSHIVGFCFKKHFDGRLYAHADLLFYHIADEPAYND